MNHERQLNKNQLLLEIEKQRFDLSRGAQQWLRSTTSLDKGWGSLYRARKIILAGVIILVVYNLRQPSRLMRWSRYSVTALNSWNIFRRILP